jgi:ectoine hydroxylase-related dioxygenase (phytanoyl-CoA dioxygenase family)
MLAIDAASEGNGCLRVVPGSHLHGCLPGTADGTQLGGFYTDPAAFDETRQVAVAVPAGSLIFFHPHLVHGSRPNGSSRPRRALVLTYQPAGFPMLKSGRHRPVACGRSG